MKIGFLLHIIRTWLLLPLVAICLSSCFHVAETPPIPQELLACKVTITQIDAFKPNPQFDRHDPSNIIRHDDLYWVFYTHNIDDHKTVTIHFASSTDGTQWKDMGQAIGCGAPGDWDESGSIAPYVVPHNGRFYLFYTGFRGGNLDTRQLGCAIADSPRGPWTRWRENPILRQNPDPAAWDSGMLGDSNVIFREGKWWLYFKSRRRSETNKQTRIGVAVADVLTGPYRKHPANPLFAGHAFSAWVHRDGVAALCGEISPKIKWSPDGLHFVDAGEMPNSSTGFFCPANFGDGSNHEGVAWGIEVYNKKSGSRGLQRFDCTLQPNSNP
jgi:beta-xylosidase